MASAADLLDCKVSTVMLAHVPSSLSPQDFHLAQMIGAATAAKRGLASA